MPVWVDRPDFRSMPTGKLRASMTDMTKIEDRLETLFAKVRALSTDRQEFAMEVLTEIVENDVYVLSDEERAILEPALERAKRGEFATDADIDEVLNKPWS